MTRYYSPEFIEPARRRYMGRLNPLLNPVSDDVAVRRAPIHAMLADFDTPQSTDEILAREQKSTF